MEEENGDERREENFSGIEHESSNEDSFEEHKAEGHKPVVSMGTSPSHVPSSKVKEEQQLTKRMRENPWILSTLVLGAIVLVLLFLGNFSGGVTGNVVGEEGVEDIFLNVLEGQGADVTEIEITDVSLEKGLYVISFDYSGEPYPVSYYLTADGSLLGMMSPVVDEDVPLTSSGATTTAEVVKSDRPITELFIMTHCPYGTQAEKGIIPVIKALGDTADIKIRFVHYFMHDPEETETPIQVCIREEQSDKYLDYLSCYLGAGDSATCLTETQINKAKLTSCIATKSEDYYAQDSELSNQYGVQGSPTLVINGVQANSGRDSVSYLDTICSAFSTQPAECETQLSSASPSPGFGYAASASGATDATC